MKIHSRIQKCIYKLINTKTRISRQLKQKIITMLLILSNNSKPILRNSTNLKVQSSKLEKSLINDRLSVRSVS